MPTDEAPTQVNEPKKPEEITRDAGDPASDASALSEELSSASPVVRGSRWVDYDTHELLQMISELEDERRWARLREGVWLAILFHLLVLTAIFLLPKYVFKVPPVVDKSSAINPHKDFTYLDTPFLPPSKPIVKPPVQQPLIDKQTMEQMKKVAPPEPAPEPKPQPAAPAPVQPPPPPPTQQPQIEMPRPAAVPARPNFAMGSQNPADQLREAMKGASRNPGMGSSNLPSGGGLTMHPGAGTGGVEVLSDTQGVDFNTWLQRWHRETERTWDPLIPDEVNPPILKSGVVAIRFKVLPNGRLMDGSMVLEGRSGDVALDRAAWGALTGSNYPPLPRDFHGPYLELRAYFLYNMEPPR
ncbi:MAG: energy transducer TonB [Terracidiphilus sp.]|jgi:outer membrane biosynthesis protein TonB